MSQIVQELRLCQSKIIHRLLSLKNSWKSTLVSWWLHWFWDAFWWGLFSLGNGPSPWMTDAEGWLPQIGNHRLLKAMLKSSNHRLRLLRLLNWTRTDSGHFRSFNLQLLGGGLSEQKSWRAWRREGYALFVGSLRFRSCQNMGLTAHMAPEASCNEAKKWANAKQASRTLWRAACTNRTNGLEV